MTYEELAKMAEECGFTHTAPLDITTINLKQEVRDMCASGKCGMYDNCWSCPPGCGSLEECREKINQYSGGILVQTVGDLEDALDGEAMMETAHRHTENIDRMQDAILAKGNEILTLGAGACKLCAKCAYPDEPCRQPKKMHSSMEAFGMVVLEVCKANGLDYYYGSNHIAYTGCFLYK